MPVRPVQQISEAHCGPAVIQMLLEEVGAYFSQEEITKAAGAQHSIQEYGTLVEQLAVATTKLAPDTQFWYKYNSTLDDIRYILRRGYGVGVEWQGLFYDSEEEEEEESDSEEEHGHYSIVTHVDEEKGALVIIDPYKEFANQTRIIDIVIFLRRWWETNEITDPFSHKPQLVDDLRLLFFITPFYEGFPPELGFKAFSL
jgi:hypothetical protein